MKAYLLSLNPEANIANQWDFGFLKSFLDDNNFEIESVTALPKNDRAIVVIPARHNVDHIKQINKELNFIKHVVLFLMGDEEAEFPVEKIVHNSIHIWVQNPHLGKHDKYNKIGTGYPQHMSDILEAVVLPIKKNVDIFYAGQKTHQRREELSGQLKTMHRKYNIESYDTQGFTQGMNHLDYYMSMVGAKVAPAPSGAVIPDSFRLFEALECMCIPIADQRTAKGEVMEYWDWLFGEITPFPHITNWESLPAYMKEIKKDYPHNIHKQTAWWLMWKRNFKLKVLEQYNG